MPIKGTVVGRTHYRRHDGNRDVKTFRMIMVHSKANKYWEGDRPKLRFAVQDICSQLSVLGAKAFVSELFATSPSFKRRVVECSVKGKDGGYRLIKTVGTDGLHEVIDSLARQSPLGRGEIDRFRQWAEMDHDPLAKGWRAEGDADFCMQINKIAIECGRLRKTSGPKLPPDGVMGVYRIIEASGSNRVKYIGQSKNLTRRIRSHLSNSGRYALNSSYEFQIYPCEWAIQVAEMVEIVRAYRGPDWEALENRSLIESPNFGLIRKHGKSPQELIFGRVITPDDPMNIRVDSADCYHDHSSEDNHPYNLLRRRQDGLNEYIWGYTKECGAIPPAGHIKTFLEGGSPPIHNSESCSNGACFGATSGDYHDLGLVIEASARIWFHASIREWDWD